MWTWPFIKVPLPSWTWRGYVAAVVATLLWVVALVAIERTYGWPRFLTPQRRSLFPPPMQPVSRSEPACPRRVVEGSGQPSNQADLYGSETMSCRRLLQGN